MKNDKNVETYLRWIRRQLHGIERDSIDSIVEELEGHIHDKAKDIAEVAGLKKPDENIYLKVLEELGPPEVVAIDYLKILPKKPGTALMAFLGLQFVIGLIAVFISIYQFFAAWETYDVNTTDPYIPVITLVGVVFLVLGIGAMVMVWLQYKRPSLIVHYQSGSIMLSLVLAAGVLFLELGNLIWRFVTKTMNYEQVMSIAMPVFLLLNLAYVLGLRASEQFQRRIALEEIDNKLFEQKQASSRKAMAVLAVVAIILVSGAGAALFQINDQETYPDELVSTEQVGGTYNARIEHWRTFNTEQWIWIGYDKIIYTKDGKEHSGSYLEETKASLDWLKANTESNATILCWWDYGHAITGYAQRASVVSNPSENLRNTMANPDLQKEWDPQAKTEKVGKALTASTIGETATIMNETGAKYLVTHSRDVEGITYAMFRAAGLNENDYVVQNGSANPYSQPPIPEPTAKGRQTTIFKIWLGQDVNGLELVYSDLNTRIYKLEA